MVEGLMAEELEMERKISRAIASSNGFPRCTGANTLATSNQTENSHDFLNAPYLATPFSPLCRPLLYAFLTLTITSLYPLAGVTPPNAFDPEAQYSTIHLTASPTSLHGADVIPLANPLYPVIATSPFVTKTTLSCPT